MERIGILGGTFDPIHNGHLLLAADAQWDLKLDKILFVVAAQPWQKEGTLALGAFDRLVMADIATRPIPWAEVSTVEIDRGDARPTYTIDTLEELTAPGRELTLILGSDQITNLPTWHRYKELSNYAVVHPVPRWLGISSTQIRHRLQQGQSIEYLVPDGIAEYITKFGLYQG